ncbi:hypothetical protein NUU61_001181 [Penicillium alfredii]|uniref:Uncharacterized protein n=1 Tax=Penicillium alfredii TaxID=1506179 RepID=A0A9W9GBD1_9EURO|nr:uncharacterized protein NUU61_001181 [Penicillium alfredii]KAJ5115422.1 hypothetical protein NUU61_001181 [Penicillium alfredii]
MLRAQQECQHRNTKATFFLVREDGTEARDTICVPYREFHSASHFLAVMTEAYGLPNFEDSALQLQEMSGNPIRRLRYAVVRPKWAKVSFQIRAGRDADWRALQNILEVAWAASSRGDLAKTYFKIEVTLKVE